MASWPTRGQQAPDFWDTGLKAYIDSARQIRNVLDYGIVSGTTSSQTTALKALLDANPNTPFWIPQGAVIRLDTPLLVTANNSLQVDGEIYAGAPMGTLIDWDNGAVSASNYAQDKFLVGRGLINANLNAQKAVAIGSVLRFTFGEGLAIKDPINRGLYLKPAGAEVMGGNIRLYNTGTTNVADNIAVESDQGDVQLRDIISRDFTQGLRDNGGGVWTDFHPWIGTTAQLTARYPTSCAFTLCKTSLLVNPYADTYRYGFRSAATSGFARSRIQSPKFFCNTGNLTNALAAANPGAVYDFVDAGQILVVGAPDYSGHGVTPYALTQGSAIRFGHPKGYVDRSPGSVTGLGEFHRGVKMGTSNFAVNVFGSTAGGVAGSPTPSFTGLMEVRDGTVEYRFILVGTLTANFAGRFKIGGIPLPPGATAVNTGVGNIAYASGGIDSQSIIGANGTVAPLVAILNRMSAGGSTEPDYTSLAGAAIQLWGSVTCAFTYPS